MAWTAVDDVRNLMRRPLTTHESAAAASLIAYAEAALERKVPGIAARVSDGSLPVVLVSGVVAAAVARALAGTPQGTIAVDEFGQPLNEAPGVSAYGPVRFFPNELELLAPISGLPEQRSRVGVARMTPWSAP